MPQKKSIQNFIGALPLIAAMLAAIGYQFGLSPITWSYAGNCNFEIQHQYVSRIESNPYFKGHYATLWHL